MVNLNLYRLKVYSEVRAAIWQIYSHREAVIHEREIVIYDRCIDRLREVGMDVSEYELTTNLYLGDRSGFSYVGGRPEGRRVSYLDFDARAAMVLGTLKREIGNLEELRDRMKNLPAQIIEDRKVLLSWLIDTFLETRDRIAVMGTNGRLVFAKSRTQDLGFEPTIADLEALAHQGLIILESHATKRAQWHITIPTSTLILLEDSEAIGDAVAGVDRQKAIQNTSAVNNHFYGNVGNIANNSSDFQQTAYVGGVEAVVENIRQMEGNILTYDGVISLIEAVRADASQEGKPQMGPRVMGWIADVASGTSAGLLVTGLPHALQTVSSLF